MTDGAPAVATSPATEPWDMRPRPEEQPTRAKRTRRADQRPAAAIAQTSAPAPDGAPDVRRIPLDRIVESKLNPRQRYHGLEELAESLKTGQLTPCLVRPETRDYEVEGGRFELAAGHRRFRAAKLAGLAALDCVVRAMDDRRFLEVLVIENDQREDVHPLEEAQGYRQLMESAGYDVPAIAGRVGRSVKYVYDRMKLLQLTPEAKKLFLDGRFEAGHAILLARLTPKQQAAALDPQHGGLFEVEVANEVDEDGRPVDRGGQRRFGALIEGGRGHKPASVREFATWINDRVRLTESAIADPVLFPEQAAQLEEAVEQKLKVIHISVDHQLHPDARLDGVRTYGPMSWAYADGQEHRPRYGGKAKVAKTCAHAVLGLVVAGEGRGGMLQVCIAKEKCATHWPEHAKKAQARKAGTSAPAKGGSRAAEIARDKREAEKMEKERKERDARQARWRKALPAIRTAVAKRIMALPATTDGPLVRIIIERYGRGQGKPLVAPGKTAEDFVRHLAGVVVGHEVAPYGWPEHFQRTAKTLGLDVARIIDEADPQGAAKAKQAAADKKTGVREVARFKGAKKKAGKKK